MIIKIILSVLVILTCFPPTELTYSTGIDPPLSWVFNYLFKNGNESPRRKQRGIMLVNIYFFAASGGELTPK